MSTSPRPSCAGWQVQQAIVDPKTREVLPELPRDSCGDLRHFERVCKPSAIEIAIPEVTVFPKGKHKEASQTLRGINSALDPQSVETQSWLAIAFAARVMDQMTASTIADIRRAEALVQRIMMTAPRNILAHFTKGQVLRVQRRYAEAVPEYETVIALNRNYVNAFGALAECKLFAGSIHEMIPLHERAIRLSPRDPHIGIWYFRIGVAHLLQSRIDEAVEWLERGRGANAALPYVHSHLASAYALKGEAQRAMMELAEARKLSGDNRYSSLARLRTLQYYGVRNIESLYEATYFAGLRKAGMPEE